MKKKVLITLVLLFFIALSSAVTYAITTGAFGQQHKKPSDYKVGVSYEQAMSGEKPVLAVFYVDWCGYCMRFMPKFKALESVYKKDYNLLMINAEDPEREDLVKDVRLSGYPTLYIFDPKYDNRVHLSSSIYGDLKAFRKEVDRYTKIRKLLDKSTSCEK